ncbi:MAG: hypothetical protein VKI82_10835, partial [Leptolyngbya sp.]|nr:hypothetical protein [Leptolyngbya sp.]
MEVLPSSPLRLQMATNSLGDDLGIQPQARGCLWAGASVAARGSLWWEGWAGEDRSEPRLWLGRLGGLEATDAEAAIAFLHQACEILRQRGCSQVLGPM